MLIGVSDALANVLERQGVDPGRRRAAPWRMLLSESEGKADAERRPRPPVGPTAVQRSASDLRRRSNAA